MDLKRLDADDPVLPDVLTLIHDSFAYMTGVINPPSSVVRMTLESLRADARAREVWTCGVPLSGCVVLTPEPNAMYIGKLCVAPQARGQGIARRLVQLAQTRAQALGLAHLTLDVRIELTANHAAFAAMGFIETGRNAHAGYDAPTSISFARAVC